MTKPRLLRVLRTRSHETWQKHRYATRGAAESHEVLDEDAGGLAGVSAWRRSDGSDAVSLRSRSLVEEKYWRVAQGALANLLVPSGRRTEPDGSEGRSSSPASRAGARDGARHRRSEP